LTRYEHVEGPPRWIPRLEGSNLDRDSMGASDGRHSVIWFDPKDLAAPRCEQAGRLTGSTPDVKNPGWQVRT